MTIRQRIEKLYHTGEEEIDDSEEEETRLK